MAGSQAVCARSAGGLRAVRGGLSARPGRTCAWFAVCLCAVLAGCEVFQTKPPEEAVDAYAQARTKMSAGDFAGAATLLEGYVIASPDAKYATDAWLLLGDCRMELQDYPGAQAAYVQAQVKPRTRGIDARAKAGLGNAYMRRNLPAPAAVAWEDALRASEGDIDAAQVLSYLGKAYIRMGNWLMGRDRLARLAKRYPDSPQAPEARDIMTQPGDVYCVQVGAFSARDAAEGMVEGLRARGILGARIVQRDYGDLPWAVRVGRFVSYDAASAEAEKLKSIAADAFVFP